MASEKKRGCGYRKIGGLYLSCEGFAFACDRIPVPLHICPVCGQGVKFCRGTTWIEPARLFGDHVECAEKRKCRLCKPIPEERVMLMWVGEAHYSPKEFTREAATMGVSKRISAIPKGLVLGSTWVYCAHRKAVPTPDGDTPGIFYAFQPTHIEYPLWETEINALEPEVKRKLKEMGVRLVPIRDGDPDHKDTGKRVLIKKARALLKRENHTLDSFGGDA